MTFTLRRRWTEAHPLAGLGQSLGNSIGDCAGQKLVESLFSIETGGENGINSCLLHQSIAHSVPQKIQA